MEKTTGCVWCGRTPTTIEDIWPKWVGRYLGHRPVRQVLSGGGRRYGSFRGLSNVAKARVVCEVCNGGWMHDLEEASVYIKRMFDEKVNLRLPAGDDETRHLMAQWCFKTALMVQYVHGVSVVPAAVYHDFHPTRELPDGCMIFLARHETKLLPNGAHAVVLDVSLAAAPTLKGEIYGITFFIKNVVVQVIGHRAPFGVHVYLPQTFRPYVYRLWPPGRPVEWPPILSLSDEGVIQFGEALAGMKSAIFNLPPGALT